MEARTVKRRKVMSAGNSAEPMQGSGSTCGHGGCGPGSCNVRYVGLTSHIRDHHALHAARGVIHIWTAAVVTGLAVVLTGAVAYTVVQAAPVPDRGAGDWSLVMSRLEQMERSLAEVKTLCASRVPSASTSTPDGQPAGLPNAHSLTRP